MNSRHEKEFLKRTAELEKELAAKNRQLEIETALEKVRAVAIAMKAPGDMLDVCRIISQELEGLGVKDIRNVQTAIIDEGKASYLNYEYFRWRKKTVITEVEYKKQKDVNAFVKKMLKDAEGFFTKTFKSTTLKDWIKYQIKAGQYVDPHLYKVTSLHYYFYSIGPGALGISTYAPLRKEAINLFKRFRNVFQLAYSRFIDIEKAEAQAREAQIEASLEKVRAQALGMHKPDDLLNVCKVLFKELNSLGFEEMRNAIIHTFNDEKKYFLDYDYSDLIGGVITHIPYSNDPVIKRFLKQIRKSDEAFVEDIITGKELNDWKKFRKRGGQPDDPRLNKASALYYYFYSVGNGSIGISTFSSINAEMLQLLRRFRNVFDFAYRRYMDMALAEAQAREAQIELGLERVRARAMAMQTSEELNTLIGTVFTELTRLDLVLTRCVILIYEGNEKGVRWWMANSEAPSMPMSFFVKYADLPFFNMYLKGWADRSLKWQYVLEGENKAITDDFLFNETELLQLPDFVIAGMRAPERIYLNASFNNFGNLTLASLEPLSDEHFDILLRFAKVFDLTYTRFNDLKQAEAQARESQIQLALERVRARTMAMQRSEELPETSYILFQQMKELGEPAEQLTIGVVDEENNVMEISATLHGDMLKKIYLHSIDEPLMMSKVYNAWKNQQKTLVIELKGDELNAYNKYRNELTKSEMFPTNLGKEHRRIVYTAFFSKGILALAANDSRPPQSLELLERFASVFDLTYTRFLDLQKAEAQAREAQIEAALEKVRGSAMAMYNSNDISTTTTVVFSELKKLGIASIRCGVALLSKNSRIGEIYAAATSSDGELKTLRRSIEMTEHSSQEQQYQSWLRQENYFTEMKGEELRSYYQLPFFYSSPSYQPPKQYEHSEFGYYIPFSEGLFYAWTEKQYSENEVNILNRFKTIIDLTFRRYFDLQKAEAQSRESQIQLALERVRARTMAMQRSDELPETSFLLFQQMKELDVTAVQNSIGIVKEDDGFVELSTTVHGHPEPKTFHVPINDPYVMAKAVAAWKAKRKSLKLEFSGQELKDYNDHRNSFFKTKVNFPEDQWLVSIAFFSQGWLSFSSDKTISAEAFEILKRFAAVFEQAYTRFLDLHKAEEQARESQIEAALEKVRSRSLAMHTANELSEVVTVIVEKLTELGVVLDANGVVLCTYFPDSKNVLHWIVSPDFSMAGSYLLPYFDHPIFNDAWNSKIAGDEYFSKAFSIEEKNSFFEYAFEHSDYKNFPNEFKQWVFQNDKHSLSFAWQKNSAILIPSHTGVVPTETDKVVLIRFSKVFEQAYVRFMDLQKAEAQAREAQIEASLERVRAKAMAMHKSDDLNSAVAIVFQELGKLNIEMSRCGLGILNKEKRTADVYTTTISDNDTVVQVSGDESMDIHPLLRGALEAWLRQEEDFSYVLEGEDMIRYYEVVNQSNFKLPESQLISSKDEIQRQYYYVTTFHAGGLFAFRDTPFTEEAKKVMKRFANVFDLTYKRFLDLQKAEANVREAQIEASLERVRSKTMAMHNSKDVGDTVATMFDELVKLGVETVRCGIGIMHKANRMEVWTAKKSENGKVELIIGSLDMTIHPLLRGMYNGWKNKEITFSYELKGDDLVDYFTKLINSPDYQINYDITSLPQHQFHNDFYFPEGALFSFSAGQLSKEATQIFKRFAGVFGQTYRRYLDLQKAEAQAREAQIEASLERVRSKTMAMHNSQEVGDTVATLFDELIKLGIETFRCGIGIMLEKEQMEVWTAKQGNNGKADLVIGHLDMSKHLLLHGAYNGWRNKKESSSYELKGDDLTDYFTMINDHADYPVKYDISSLPSQIYHHDFYFSEGTLFVFSLNQLSAEASQIFKRFAGVFGQTYRRYLDLQKAEAQAREATIEAALEKVRGKAMAMHNSNDLSVTASMVFTELRKLGISPIRCGVGLLNKKSRKGQLYSATSSADGDSLSLVGWVMLSGHPVLEKIYDTWLNNEEYYPELIGEQLKSYYELLLSGLPVPVPKDTGQKQYGTFLPFSVGCLYAWSEAPYNETEIKVLKRFATIVDLTFRRYIELQKSEANAREAVKQAALDRIRADIASMRTITDLDRITPLIWNELTILGIPFIRCGVFIMDESQRLIHTFLSTPDGRAIAAFHLQFNTPGNIAQVVSHWKERKNYIDHWDEKVFTEFANTLVEQEALTSTEQYLSTIPQSGFYLHFLPFLQGMLYVGNTTQLSEDEIKLIQSVADAFSTAYARYEDFNKLEAAKKQVDSTLNELQITQKQLVQSEKMASLGELTAGIAHEIQNPLNFVNNFSEVSKELLDEMKTELDNGNTEDAKEIAADIIQNLEKINHHGKRADAIVKGMLQHSRTSSGQKELTDINALADEYLRLAFHGLRAKDKSFNARFETDFDPAAGKINIVQQEIGRVILNLINNAFYAVNEKKQQQPNGYEPLFQ